MNIKQVMSFVKVEHTLFSLPFVLIGYIIALEQFDLPFSVDLLWILLAAVGARGLAMALNRIIDKDIDAANPRTKERHLASGGVGRLNHFVDGVKKGQASALLAASVFHFGKLSINEVKKHLILNDIDVRMDYISR